MELNQIEAFRAVMLSGSMTAAARDLRTSQPNISRLIAQLEKSTAFRLFERVSGRLVPTDEGIAFFHEVQRSFVDMQSLIASANSIRSFGSGRLRIAVIPTLALGFLPRVITRFNARHGDVAFSIHTGSSSTVAHWTASQFCDLGIAIHGRDVGGCEAELLYQVEGVCILPAGHRLVSRKVIRPADLKSEEFISLTQETTTRTRLEAVFAEAKVRPKTTLDTPYGSIICSLVAQGLGVSIVNPLVARGFVHTGIVIRPFKPAVPYAADILFALRQPRSALARSFVEMMRLELQSQH
jgi:DNA-binding transcriptional LysR family regulator